MSLVTANKLIILDRDGVINQDSDDYVKSASEWLPIEGSITAIAALSQAGFMLAVATNQSGIGRGLFDLDDLQAMHTKMNTLVENAMGELAGVFYCPHTPDDHCTCRKPKTGLVDAIETELGVTAKGALFVGDSLRDLEAAISKQCHPVLVLTGKGKKTMEKLQNDKHPLLKTLAVFDSLSAFSEELLTQ